MTSSLKWASVALAFVPGLMTVSIFVTEPPILASTAAIIVDFIAFLWIAVTVIYYRRTRTFAAAKLFALLLIVLPRSVFLISFWVTTSLSGPQIDRPGKAERSRVTCLDHPLKRPVLYLLPP